MGDTASGMLALSAGAGFDPDLGRNDGCAGIGIEDDGEAARELVAGGRSGRESHEKLAWWEAGREWWENEEDFTDFNGCGFPLPIGRELL